MADADFPLSLADLQAVGLSYTYAHNIVRGHRAPSVEVAGRLLDRFGVAIGPLADRSPAEVETLRQADALRRRVAA